MLFFIRCQNRNCFQFGLINVRLNKRKLEVKNGKNDKTFCKIIHTKPIVFTSEFCH